MTKTLIGLFIIFIGINMIFETNLFRYIIPIFLILIGIRMLMGNSFTPPKWFQHQDRQNEYKQKETKNSENNKTNDNIESNQTNSYNRNNEDYKTKINNETEKNNQENGTSKSDFNTNTSNNKQANQARIDDFNIFNNLRKRVKSKKLEQVNVVTLFAGNQYDFSQAETNQNPLILEFVTIFGGTEIIIPEHWNVNTEGVAILGAVQDLTDKPTQTNTKIIIKGVSIFGAVEIKN